MSNDDNSIIIRIFASSGCKRCKMFKEECKKFGLPHISIDANDKSNEDLCDKYEVNQLPHIQVVREMSGLVMLEYAGYIHPISFLNTFKKKIKKSSSQIAKGKGGKVSSIPDGQISKNPGCSSCQKAREDQLNSSQKKPALPPRQVTPSKKLPPAKKKGCSKCGQKKNK